MVNKNDKFSSLEWRVRPVETLPNQYWIIFPSKVSPNNICSCVALNAFTCLGGVYSISRLWQPSFPTSFPSINPLSDYRQQAVSDIQINAKCKIKLPESQEEMCSRRPNKHIM